MEFLYEDKDIIVCVKEPGVPVQADKTRSKDMVNMLRNYVIESEYGYTKEKGIPFIGLVHRLDRPVGGVMVFAKTPDALKKLNMQMNNGGFGKRYYAISENGDFENVDYNKWIRIEDYLLKDGRNNISKVVKEDNKGAKKAILEYRIVNRCVGMFLYEVKLKTGRHHQIRVQMSHHGMPLIGDTKYNQNPKEGQIALYSYRLEFMHPKTGEKMNFENKPTHGVFGSFVD